MKCETRKDIYYRTGKLDGWIEALEFVHLEIDTELSILEGV